MLNFVFCLILKIIFYWGINKILDKKIHHIPSMLWIVKDWTILVNRPWYSVFCQCCGNDLRHVRRWERKWHNTIRDVLSCPITDGFHNWPHWVCRQLSFASHRFPGCTCNKVYIAIAGKGSFLSYVLLSFLCSTFES